MKVIEYVLSLKDKMSGTLTSVNRGIDSLEGKLSKFRSSSNSAAKNYVDATGRMRDANGRFAKSTQSTTDSVSSGFGKLIGGLGAAYVGAKLLEFGKDAIVAGANMEQTRVQFETFTGSAKKGNEVIAQLQKFSLATPFDDEQVLKAGKSLLAFGVGTDELQTKLTQIGNISSATGKDFNELTTIYGKAKTAGTLYAEDINQLVEAGIPIIDEFAKQLGVPTSQVKKMASQGKISFGMLEKGFDNLGGASGRWGALMDKQSKTLAGKWSSLVGYTQNLMGSLGEGQIPFLNTIVDKAGEVLNWIKDNKSKLAELFVPLQNAIQPLFDSFARIRESMGLTGSVSDMLSKVFEYVGYAVQLIAPFVSVAAKVLGVLYENIAKVIGVVYEWIKKNKQLQTDVMGMYSIFKTAFTAIGDIATKIFGRISKTIDGILNKDFSKIASGLSDIAFAPAEVLLDKNTYKDLGKTPTLTNFFAPKSATEEARSSAQGAKSSLTKPTGTSAATDKKTSLTTKAGDVAGTKPVTINLTIQKMVGAENINTTTVTGSLQNVEKLLMEMLRKTAADASLLAASN